MKTESIDINQTEIINVARLLTTLMIEKKTSEMNDILDQNFTLTHITGLVQPKHKWLSEIETEQMKYYSYQEVKTTVTMNGEMGTFVGQNLLDARIWGMRNTWRLQQTMLFEKRNGKWVILKSVATLF